MKYLFLLLLAALVASQPPPYDFELHDFFTHAGEVVGEHQAVAPTFVTGIFTHGTSRYMGCYAPLGAVFSSVRLGNNPGDVAGLGLNDAEVEMLRVDPSRKNNTAIRTAEAACILAYAENEMRDDIARRQEISQSVPRDQVVPYRQALANIYQIYIDRGLNPYDKTQDTSTNWGLGNKIAALTMPRWKRLPVNREGDQCPEITTEPFGDCTGFEPRNPRIKTTWVPPEKLVGNRHVREDHLTPGYAEIPLYARTTPESYDIPAFTGRRGRRNRESLEEVIAVAAEVALGANSTTPETKAEMQAKIVASIHMDNKLEFLNPWFASMMSYHTFGEEIFSAEDALARSTWFNIGHNGAVIAWDSKVAEPRRRPIDRLRDVVDGVHLPVEGLNEDDELLVYDPNTYSARYVSAFEWEPVCAVDSHGSYPSGTTLVIGSAAALLKEFFGDATDFTLRYPAAADCGQDPRDFCNHRYKGVLPTQEVEISFTSYDEFIQFVGYSRVLCGVHDFEEVEAAIDAAYLHAKDYKAEFCRQTRGSDLTKEGQGYFGLTHEELCPEMYE